ncbi:ABC transporter substrate-binding protein [Desertimonas flava]|jgi:peptide/nickel transport system substrate-binding protein|uniref:ABC transporter substrate-binding protein n=1 Tax=Desertimonas flava TaxID=2064846 RepID=UPI000E3541D1|nr:ABC transporter substrate-binding protein [Desertimonas flava]
MVTAGAAGATTAPPGTDAAGTEAAGSEAPAGSDAAAGSGGVGEVGGSACGIPHGPWEPAAAAPSGEVRVAWNDPLLSFNSNTNRGNATANNNPLYLMNAGGFSMYNADLELINNDQFGTCTIESLDPLTITYRINEGVTWSDGTQVDAADLILQWGAGNGQFNDASTVVTGDTGETAEADENGNPIIVGPDGADITSVDEEAYNAAYDPDSGALLEGYAYKISAGVAFDTSSPSLALISEMPTISEDGLAVTTVWDSFYVDYQIAGLSTLGVPAHVVAQRALGIEDPAEAKQALIDAFANDDPAALKPIADFWNTGFDANSLPDDPGLYLGVGPYNLTAYDEVTQMTFEAREGYTWGPQPNVQTIVYRIIGDPTAAVQALQNEEIDIIQPQATADILDQLAGLADRGVEVISDNGATFEHVDLAMNNGGPFDPAAYGGDEATALAVRQAFLKTIPRQEILDRLIVPLVPDAVLRDSFTQVPGSPMYEGIASTNGVRDFAEVDIEGATALLEEAGVTTPLDVRFLYAANNPRRAAEYELIRDSAAQAGFNVIDGNSPTWGVDLNNTDLYDAALFGWQSTSINVSDSESNYATDTINNHYGFSNAEVDELYAQLQVTTDAAEQEAILGRVEAILVEEAFGIPIFQHPSITGYNSTYVSGVSNIAIAPTVFFNVWEWQAVG